jgi:hypothetical protein
MKLVAHFFAHRQHMDIDSELCISAASVMNCDHCFGGIWHPLGGFLGCKKDDEEEEDEEGEEEEGEEEEERRNKRRKEEKNTPEH